VSARSPLLPLGLPSRAWRCSSADTAPGHFGGHWPENRKCSSTYQMELKGDHDVQIVMLALLLLVVLSAAVGLTVFASQGGGSVQINQRIAGSIFNWIEVTKDPSGDPHTVNRSLLNLYAKGAPGAANIEVVGGAEVAVEPSGSCTGTPFVDYIELTFIDGGCVETFIDHSMLFYVLDESPDANNALCMYFDGRPTTGVFDYLITGGVGRFEGATGSATVAVTSWGVRN
jgi:hypothetical protein